jgi:hypothetical protein
MIETSYVMPMRRGAQAEDAEELWAYIRILSTRVREVIIVDGSPPKIFEAHAAALGGSSVRHVSVNPELVTPMGKVGGVLTGLRLASHERVVIADDDVRYTSDALTRVVTLLGRYHVVRPQNYFDPLPWHARYDTARTLLNRLFGGDWPGTLGVRRSALGVAGGYDGGVMFENLELVRTVRAVGGTEVVPLDLFVARRPPSTRHFFSQRVRQAYDELARPLRFGLFLAMLPLATALAARRRWAKLGVAVGASVVLAEAGRRRGGGTAVFPATASLLAPAWLAERAACVWLALGARLFLGGIPYGDSVLRLAATPSKELRRRHGAAALAGREVPLVARRACGDGA